MTRDFRQITEENTNIVKEDCNCSGYTMAAVAGCLLLCIGIILYALIAA